MITDLWIENFKGIGKLQHIPLRPVTLLFGANSAGKTSVIAALEFWRQIVVERNLSAVGDVNSSAVAAFGGFKNLVHQAEDGKLCKAMSLGVKIKFSKNELAVMSGCSPEVNESSAIESMRFHIVLVNSPEASAECHALVCWVNEQPLLFIDSEDVKIIADHPLIQRGDLAPFFRGTADDLASVAAVCFGMQTESIELKQLDIPELLRFFSSYEIPLDQIKVADLFSLNELLSIGWEALSYRLSGLTHLGAKRATVPRWLTSRFIWPRATWDDGSAAWNWLLRTEPLAFYQVAKWMGPDHLRLGFHVELRSCIEIQSELRDELIQDETSEITQQQKEALRESRSVYSVAVRDEIGRHLDPQDVGEGITQVVPVIVALIRPQWQLPDDVQKQLPYRGDDFPLDYTSILSGMLSQKEITELGLDQKKIHEEEDTGQQLRDSKLSVHGLPADIVGGLSLVAIEQPELHLHPSVAARLGDLFSWSTKKVPGLTILAETHSEHIILRLLRRIRQTTDDELPEHIPPVKPDDVCVLYVDNVGNGTTIKRLRIDEHGEFIDRWPHGFFRERAEELF